MGNISIRNLDEQTIAALNDMAKKNKYRSREELIRNILTQYARSEELNRLEEKYATLILKLEEVLNYNSEVLEKNNFLLEKVIEKL